ncbi:hypothetical protein GCM10011391_25790 [Pullulanibacillus camelliae]|uniref:DUF1002 domain-containing protein n=1 Tax=Pullulanibacillus camelliae TaxID=1707096 RepID=A0A8J2YIH5_9BACL|nr:DUF1002 domain-containing protein [Pullulanibacillus camelliae]GGE45777.1 hypothetical protein GCM10011391_25790 [Pullulanibacillus camelliae]
MNRAVYFILSAVIIIALSIAPQLAHADAAPGDTIVTLGADLTAQQKQQILQEMNVDQNHAQIIEVTNAEEHKYLDNYLPKAQIGTRAISSSKITIGEKNTGLSVSTNHITYVSNDMYINALATAGVKDAQVYVTAPFDVSGTAGLTGLIKAYELSTGDVIPEQQKQVANEEMVTTAKLANDNGIGKDKAAQLMTLIKEKMAKENPKTDADIEKIIREAADQLGIHLTDAQVQKLVDLFKKMQDLHINWNQVGDQLQKVKGKLNQVLNSDEAKGFFAKLVDFIRSLFHSIAALFQ